MEFAGDSLAFQLLRFDQLSRECLLRCMGSTQLLQANLVRQRHQSDHSEKRKRLEPSGLVKMRAQVKCQRCSRFGPDAFVIAAYDSECVATWRKIRVVGDSSRSGLNPFF